MRLGRTEPAIAQLEKALQAGGEQAALHRMLAHAYFALERCGAVLRHLRAAGQRAWADPPTVAVRAACLHRQQKEGAALKVLREGQRLFPHDALLRGREVTLLIGLALYQEVVERAMLWQRQEPSVVTSETLGTLAALLAAGADAEAVALGEQLRLQKPNEPNVTVALAQAYAKAGQPLAAAELYDGLSFAAPEHTAAAAELYRRAGRHHLAELAIARIADRKEKLRQRFGLLLDTGRFQEAAAMARSLTQAGLTSDDNLLYALSFAQMHAGQWDAAEKSAAAITDPGAFRKAPELMQAIAQCRQEAWRCL